jgi:hypothetical protein
VGVLYSDAGGVIDPSAEGEGCLALTYTVEALDADGTGSPARACATLHCAFPVHNRAAYTYV